MSDELKVLYRQIKERSINQEEAARQLELLTLNNNLNSIPPSNPRDNILPKVYAFNESILKDHTIDNEQVLIGMTHGSLAINTFFNFFPEETSVNLHKLNFIKPIEVKREQQVEVLVSPIKKGSTIDFQVMYRHTPDNEWDLTAIGSLQKASFMNKEKDVEKIKNSLQEIQNYDYIYESNPTVQLGDTFKTITSLYSTNDQVLTKVALNQTSLEEDHNYILHPLIIHSAFIAAAPILGENAVMDGFLPFGIKDINLHKIDSLETCWLHVKLVRSSEEMLIFDTDVIDDNSQLVAQFLGCSIKRLRSTNTDYIKNQTLESENLYERDQGSSAIHDPEDEEKKLYISEEIQMYLMNKLKEIVSGDLSLSDVKVNLMDMGLESSELVTLAKDIENELKIELYPTLFFEYPNIEELVEFFYQEHKEPFTKYLGVSSQSVKRNIQDVTKIVSSDLTKESSDFKEINMQTSKSVNEKVPNDDIAIIGMHGVFAEASDLHQYWVNLRDKKDVIKEIPLDHWDYRPWYDSDPEVKDKTYCKWGSFIDDVDKFDASFFNISPREAEWMDPQLRLLMQSIYATGEDAGYINRLRGTNTGVFIGACFHDYADKIAEMNLSVDPHMGTGNATTVLSNRISFAFDFKGPSLTMDTACSSSLFALHYACRSLRDRECDMAFVGGANLLLSSWHYRYFCSIGALSPTGRCHTFDEAADGYVPGECIASMLLKPLKQAKKDGDHIYAVIKGSAALHGGYTPSLTAPSVAGEENVILKAWENAGINPETISYIEAHGTGTRLGDPIEINSLKKAFKRFTDKENFCAIGSAKAHIGHAEGAAGIAGILKVILQMKQKKIPAMPKFKKLNTYVQLDKSALYINQELKEWESPVGVPRRAGVSSFGFAGAYAHAVIEEFIPEQEKRSKLNVTLGNPAIIVLSAKKEEGLKEKARQLLETIHKQKLSDTDLFDIAYTLQIEREPMEHRLALIVGSIKELEEKLRIFIEGQRNIEYVYRGQVKGNTEVKIFTDDEDLQGAIDSWIAKRKYSRLLELWVKGMVVDWKKLYGNMKVRHINLPTYPFAKERYWVSEKKEKNNTNITISIEPLSQIKPSVIQNPLVYQSTQESELITVSNKSNMITLEPLINSCNSTSDFVKRTEQQVTLSSANGVLTPLENKQEFKQINPTSSKISILEEELAKSLAEILYMQRGDINLGDKFIDVGLDSITGVNWIKEINKKYQTSLPTTKVYDYPTIYEFAKFLEGEVNGNGNQRSNDSTDLTLYQSSTEDKSLNNDPKLNNSLTNHSNDRFKNLNYHNNIKFIEEELVISLAEVLYMQRSDVDLDDKFINMGLDSITGVSWIREINKKYNTSVSTTKVYDYPTIREFAKFLDTELNQKLKFLNETMLDYSSLTLDKVLQQVELGELDIEQAEQLLKHINVKEN
ncbi:beta-ketoacyl synthase N-terminal-like domain-containing protein [Lysinibacillus sp. NPDC092081]|uniref:beta-ketoacyl synthase N-terminal-like domain-containing protein n=1 Tax=Lysinibacillus sp. NPDC092081 TaxID=3364131 RepID=UPI003811DDAB